jgi:hypothetical protein
MHTILILNPGHFHAALVLRESHPALSQDIYVYSEPGPDLDRFLEMVDAFINRKINPVDWRIHVYTGPDYLEKLIEAKKGDIVVMAGKNHTKMEQIERLNRAGFSVLADKPWVITAETLPLLQAALEAQRPLSIDIMTERFEITTLLQKDFLAEEDVFGMARVDEDGSPTVFKESIHHLYKIVNDQPLVRPPWHFDINVQGEGIVDVTSHLVDMTHWMLFPGAAIDFEQDVELLQARHWSTLIPLDKFRKITQLDHFPDSIQNDVKADGLHYFCNGELIYRVKEIPVHIRVIWNLEIPEGGGVELLIIPRKDAARVQAAVQRCLQRWSHKYPGLSLSREENKILIDIPDELRTTHEEHFCQVRDMYLDTLAQGVCPPETRACLASKYTLLAEARKRALASPFDPLK